MRNALGREKLWREKFTSEFIDMDKADHNDLRVMFDEINEKDMPDELICFWEYQEKINSLASPQGYRWHPKYVNFKCYHYAVSMN